MNYFEKLKDPRWKKKRLEIMQRDEFTCQRCYDDKKTLNVHHRWYNNLKEPWDVPPECLVTLCEECHEYEKENMPCASNDIIQMLKYNGFLSDDINVITDGFLNLKWKKYPNDVIVSIINYALSNIEIFDYIEKKYYKSIHKKENDNGK